MIIFDKLFALVPTEMLVFPPETASKNVKRSNKKIRWDLQSGLINIYKFWIKQSDNR